MAIRRSVPGTSRRGKNLAAARRPGAARSRTHRRSSRPGTSRSHRSRSQPKRRRNRKYPDFNFPKTVPQNMQGVKFNSYIKKVLKKVKPNISMHRDSVRYMDMILKDTLHMIAQTASDKMGKRKTLKPKVLQRALKKIMPKTVWVNAHEHGQRALERYMANRRKRKDRTGHH